MVPFKTTIMNRIRVVGSSGSGKTTFSDELSRKLKIPHIELDALFHQPNWTKPDEARFIQDVTTATQGNRWIVEGNYSSVSEFLWTKADTLIFLDLPLRTVLFRSTLRSLRRILTREVLWNGNVETWSAIFSFNKRNNMILWTLSKHRSRKAFYSDPELLQKHPNLVLIRLKSIQEISDFLTNIKAN
jgi:adenylate kinase family enzyme